MVGQQRVVTGFYWYLISVVGVIAIALYKRTSFTFAGQQQENLNTPTTSTQKKMNRKKMNRKSDVIYGHVHVAKTAGSSLVDLLVSKYDGVCSNKMSSRMVNDNQRFIGPHCKKKMKDSRNLTRYSSPTYPPGVDECDLGDNKCVWNDHGCDYVSSEGKATFWTDVNWNRPMELHVPCKDEINLLMSNCYYRRGDSGFDCSPEKTTENALTSQIRHCFAANRITNRFNEKLVEDAESNNITLKCFDNNITFDTYQDYMDERLPHRGIMAEMKMCRPRLRNKETECIWKDPSLIKRVIKILRKKYYYFDYCNRCLGSSDDIFPSTR